MKFALKLAWGFLLLVGLAVSGFFAVRAGISHDYAEGAYWATIAILYKLAMPE